MINSKISIIIVNYNVKELIDKCIHSILKHCSEELFEIIVVDNNSSDGSVELIKKKYPRVHLISCSENHGFAKANNIGYENSKGEYVLMLNPDTEFIEDSLTPLLSIIKTDEQIGAIGCRLLNTDRSLQASCFDFPSNFNFIVDHTGLSKLFPSLSSLKKAMDYNKMHEIDFVRGAFLLTRRCIIQEHGFLDSQYFMYAEETDYCNKLRKLGYKTIYSPVTSIVHHQGQSSKQVNITMFVERYKSLFKYFKKNKGGLDVLMLRINCLLIFSIGLVYCEVAFHSKSDKILKKYYKDRSTGLKCIINSVLFERSQ